MSVTTPESPRPSSGANIEPGLKVPDDLPLVEVDDRLGDAGGVVADALQVAGDLEEPEPGLPAVRGRCGSTRSGRRAPCAASG